MLAEHFRVVASLSTTHPHLFILQNESNPQTRKMLGVMRAKMNVAEDKACASVGGSIESNMHCGRQSSLLREEGTAKC